MDASGWAIVIGAVFIGITQIVSMILAYLREQAKMVRDMAVAKKVEEVKDQAEQAAEQVKEVKTALEETTSATSEKLDKIAETSDKTHTLVNSNMGVQLKLNAELSRWKADQTKDKSDEAAAIQAEHMFREHEGKQATVDAGRK